MKRFVSIAICLIMLMSACGTPAPEDNIETASVPSRIEEETVVETETKEIPPLPEGLDFSGSSFTFGIIETPNAHCDVVVEELTGEVLNDSLYNTMDQTSAYLNTTIKQEIIPDGYPGTTTIRALATAGDDTLQVSNLFCAAIPTLMTDGYVRDYNDIPYINLDNSWWDHNANESLVLGNMRYSALGDLSISTHDLTFVLLFSKEMVAQNQLDSPYQLVRDKQWTMDTMRTMMETVTRDANGDGAFTTEDIYGYLGIHKHLLPGFWIGAGEKTIELNEEHIPEVTMKGERFYDVILHAFEITVDNNVSHLAPNTADVPQENINMFQEGKGLFLDCSMMFISALREMQTDFGIIPYPMYNETQDDYHVRICYFIPPIVLVTNQNLELTGAVIELANYYAHQDLTPAYYDIMLKGKYSRDEESVDMLDLIFSHRMLDLGDTVFCEQVRDGFMRKMVVDDRRDIASQVERNYKVVETTLKNMLGK